MQSKITTGARLLFGVIFVVFGANFFLKFIPMPPPPDNMMKIFSGFMETGYLLQLVKVMEIVGGILLLANLYVPLVLVMLAPIAVNIFAIHLFAEPSGLPMGILLLVLNSWLIYAYRSYFAPMLQARNNLQS